MEQKKKLEDNKHNQNARHIEEESVTDTSSFEIDTNSTETQPKHSEFDLFPEVVAILQRTEESMYGSAKHSDKHADGEDKKTNNIIPTAEETKSETKDSEFINQDVQIETKENVFSTNAKPAFVESPEEEDEKEYLEEKYYEPTTMTEDGFSIGDVINLGDKDFTVDEVLARAYYKAHIEGEEQDTFVLVSTKPRALLWRELPPQRLLPEVIYEGDEGYVLNWVEGEVLEPKLTWQVALQHLGPLVQLLRFFAAQDIAVYDINPNGLILTEQGLRLRYPLQIAKVGEEITLAPRDSFTPTEVQVNKVAGIKAGIYIWGAIFYYLYKGKPVPLEGVDPLELSAIKEPGLPQILYATLSPVHNRIDATTLQRRIKSLQRPIRPAFVIAAATTIGLAPEREINEDSYGFVQNTLETFEGSQQILRACVADGMGGEVAGEIASRAAVKTFCESIPLPNLTNPKAQVDWSVNLTWQANEAVLDVLDDDGGGCTFTSIVVINGRLTLAHVGDSRAYLYHSDNGLQPLTRDHSLVKAMIDQGVMTEAEAEGSPDANKVIRSLGARRQQQEDDAYIDTLASLTDENNQPIFEETRDIQPKEIILLMSDGVWGVWGYKESMIQERLIEIIEANYTAQQLADDLIKAALDEGAPDNATVVVVKRLR